jgi:raffinose/stachyose/melibiose transport system permease protein
MATSTLPAPTAGIPTRGSRIPRLSFTRPNIIGGLGGWLWLAIIIIPLYYVVVTSLKDQTSYFTENPLALPSSPTLDNYRLVLQNDFVRYFVNSVIVTIGTVLPVLVICFMASYAIVRGHGRLLRLTNSMFLLGLAIPVQAVIIPIYFMITKIRMYDTLAALILPSIAFAIPISVLILTTFLRDVPKELFESMRLDGCTEFDMMWRLALPLVRPAVVTVAIYDALQVWNGFLFPLILTQSPEKRVLPLSIWTFQGEFSVNTPAILASVVLSSLPLLIAYMIGRRQLVAGLTAGFGK